MNGRGRQFEEAGVTPLEVRGVTKAFRPSRMRFGSNDGARRGPHTAVDNVSFRVAPGEIYGVIGANGSLTGYAGGLENKVSLHILEGITAV